MKRVIRILLWSGLIVFVLMPLVMVFLALEKKPLVFDAQIVRTGDAVRTGRFARQVAKDLLENTEKAHVLSVTEADLNALFTVGHRSIPRASAVSVISPELFELEGTLEIPNNIVGNYLNFRLNLLPSTSGFRVARATIGDLFLPEVVVRFLAEIGLDLLFGKNEGGPLLGAVDAVALKKGQIDVHLKPISNMPQLVQKMKSRVRLIRDEVALLGNPKDMRHYYAALIQMGKEVPSDQTVSLSYFTSQLFQMAMDRGGDPVIENRAAILALGIYLGSWRVEQLTGPVRTAKMKQEPRLDDVVVLAGRVDLRLHFLISAVLQIASESGVTHAIGEFKELLDAGEGGSGFSFVDLAADRAGVRFSEVATNKSTARYIQAWLSQHRGEDQFFPEIKNLPEGLSEAVFIYHFGNIESERYIQLVQNVDACLNQLPAYAPDQSLLETKGCDITYVVPAALLP